MVSGKAQLAPGRAVGAQLVGDELVWSEALLLEQLAHEPQGSLRVPPGLDQQVQDLASLSTARHRYILLPWIETTISHLPVGFGRIRRRLRANRGPNFRTQRRAVS